MSVEITHDWQAGKWDWPLQHNNGVVKVVENAEKWEVGLDAQFFTPKEIEVKVAGDHIAIHCKHESRVDSYGSVTREINRSYQLPADVDASTIKSHLNQRGVLHITGQKKH